MVGVQTARQARLEQQRVMAQQKMRALVKRRRHGSGRGVETDGKLFHFRTAGGHLHAGAIPGRLRGRCGNFFYGCNDFSQLHSIPAK